MMIEVAGSRRRRKKKGEVPRVYVLHACVLLQVVLAWVEERHMVLFSTLGRCDHGE